MSGPLRGTVKWGFKFDRNFMIKDIKKKINAKCLLVCQKNHALGRMDTHCKCCVFPADSLGYNLTA
jgi:hypothetical protein